MFKHLNTRFKLFCKLRKFYTQKCFSTHCSVYFSFYVRKKMADNMSLSQEELFNESSDYSNATVARRSDDVAAFVGKLHRSLVLNSTSQEETSKMHIDHNMEKVYHVVLGHFNDPRDVLETDLLLYW